MLKRAYLLILIAATSLAAGAVRAEDRPEDRAAAAAAGVELFTTVNDVLDGVKDEQSAAAAKPKLIALAERASKLKEIEMELEKTESVAKDKMGFAMKTMQFMGQWNRFLAQATRLGDTPAWAVIEEPCHELSLFKDRQER